MRGGRGVTRVMCDSHAGLGAGHVTPRYTLHVTAGAAAAAVYIVHCQRAAHGDNIVGCFVQRLADFLEYRYI